LGQLVRQRNWRRHVVVVLGGGLSEQHALVASAARVHAHGDVTGLLVDAGDHCTSVGIESVEGIVVADGGHNAPHQGLEVNVSFGGDFARDHNQAGGCERLAGYAAVRI